MVMTLLLLLLFFGACVLEGVLFYLAALWGVFIFFGW
jgi:hypothetical protein